MSNRGIWGYPRPKLQRVATKQPLSAHLNRRFADSGAPGGRGRDIARRHGAVHSIAGRERHVELPVGAERAASGGTGEARDPGG